MAKAASDRIYIANFPEKHVRLTLIDVTETAQTLERNHLCGPAAGLIQADIIAGTVLMGTSLERPGQKLALRLDFPKGRLGGATMECSADFAVRGYTRQKVIAELDEPTCEERDIFRKGLGVNAKCGVVVSEGMQSHEAVFDVNAIGYLTMSTVVESYFDTSLERFVMVHIGSATEDGFVARVRAMMCETDQEIDEDDFYAVRDLFDSPRSIDLLNRGADIETLGEYFELGKIGGEIIEKPVRFACSCSSERVMSMLASLPKEEITAMIEAEKNHDIYCHMCGKGFVVTPEQLRTLL